MEGISLLNALPDVSLIKGIADELIVDPSFIEKDWHMMQLAAVIAAVPTSDVDVYFAGGTSLSKAYKLVERFSEDLDFKLVLKAHAASNPSKQRSARRAYRMAVFAAISAIPEWTLQEEPLIGDKSRYFQAHITYQPIFTQTDALRAHLKLEMSFSDHLELAAEQRPLQSFVAQANNALPEVPTMLCVSPVETAADKVSALTWRILARDRHARDDDPTIIRHLHDLAALAPFALGSDVFAQLARDTIEADKNRAAISVDTVAAKLEALLQTLNDDLLYRTEYQHYVLTMAYGKDETIPSFEQAIAALKQLIARISA